MMHAGNQYIKDNTLILDATTYNAGTDEIFGSLVFESMQKESDLLE